MNFENKLYGKRWWDIENKVIKNNYFNKHIGSLCSRANYSFYLIYANQFTTCDKVFVVFAIEYWQVQTLIIIILGVIHIAPKR